MADTPAIHRWIEAGLHDPDAPEAEARRAVLEYYDSIGVDPEDYRGVHPNDLILRVNQRSLRPGRRLAADQVRAAAGLTASQFARLCRAAGYLPDGEFTDVDVEGFASFAAAGAVFSEDALIDFVRVLAAAMARVADATSALFRIDVLSQINAAGGTEVDHARLNWESAALLDLIYPPVKALFLNQLTDAVRLSDRGRQAATSGAVTTIKVAVGFVDIVGYSRRSASVAHDELARFILDFEDTAVGLVADNGGRLVKLIGDEVMFVALEPEQAIAVAAAILDAFDGTDAVPRGGVAFGEVVALGGDYYGEVVNLASRIADQAVPGELLVDAATAQALPGRLFEPAGRRELKGFDQPVALSALRRDVARAISPGRPGRIRPQLQATSTVPSSGTPST